ncbi:hypothetical protein EWM64_g6822 [Hericium alpestre]|uniref:Uncharacterized protein n=1 Tax=Hericium alpestre TaxID=135208 RepID=A0A4Y9ZUJ8_9AGAM|nr:hypothetical protein EWM64_g6822 [Hericium alpestre]
MRNAKLLHKHNSTEEWWVMHSTEELESFVQKEARALDTGAAEKAIRGELSATKKRKALEEVIMREKKRVKREEYTTKVDAIPSILDSTYWSDPLNFKIITLQAIRLQLAWLRARGVAVPAGLSGKNKIVGLQGLVDVLEGLSPEIIDRLTTNTSIDVSEA